MKKNLLGERFFFCKKKCRNVELQPQPFTDLIHAYCYYTVENGKKKCEKSMKSKTYLCNIYCACPYQIQEISNNDTDAKHNKLRLII